MWGDSRQGRKGSKRLTVLPNEDPQRPLRQPPDLGGAGAPTKQSRVGAPGSPEAGSLHRALSERYERSNLSPKKAPPREATKSPGREQGGRLEPGDLAGAAAERAGLQIRIPARPHARGRLRGALRSLDSSVSRRCAAPQERVPAPRPGPGAADKEVLRTSLPPSLCLGAPRWRPYSGPVAPRTGNTGGLLGRGPEPKTQKSPKVPRSPCVLGAQHGAPFPRGLSGATQPEAPVQEVGSDFGGCRFSGVPKMGPAVLRPARGAGQRGAQGRARGSGCFGVPSRGLEGPGGSRGCPRPRSRTHRLGRRAGHQAQGQQDPRAPHVPGRRWRRARRTDGEGPGDRGAGGRGRRVGARKLRRERAWGSGGRPPAHLLAADSEPLREEAARPSSPAQLRPRPLRLAEPSLRGFGARRDEPSRAERGHRGGAVRSGAERRGAVRARGCSSPADSGQPPRPRPRPRLRLPRAPARPGPPRLHPPPTPAPHRTVRPEWQLRPPAQSQPVGDTHTRAATHIRTQIPNCTQPTYSPQRTRSLHT